MKIRDIDKIVSLLAEYGIIVKADKTSSLKQPLYRDVSFWDISNNGIMIVANGKTYVTDKKFTELDQIIKLKKRG